MYLSHNVNEDHQRHGLHQGGHELDEPPHDAGEHHAAAAGHCVPLAGVLMSWPPVSCLLPGHDEPWPSLPRHHHRHHRTSHAAGFSRQLRSPNCSPSQAAVAWARQCPCIHYYTLPHVTHHTDHTPSWPGEDSQLVTCLARSVVVPAEKHEENI